MVGGNGQLPADIGVEQQNTGQILICVHDSVQPLLRSGQPVGHPAHAQQEEAAAAGFQYVVKQLSAFKKLLFR